MNATAKLAARVAGAVIALGMVGAGTITATQSIAHVTHEEVQELPANLTYLVVQGTKAEIEVLEVSGADKPSVRSSITGGGRAKRAQVSMDRDIVTVTDPCASGSTLLKGWDHCTASITITVPKGARVDVESDFGSVRLTGLHGPVSADLEVGDLVADSVSGPLNLSLDVGDAQVLNSHSPLLEVFAAVGEVSIESAVAPTTLIVDSDVGDVSIALPTDGYTYSVDTSAEGPGTGFGIGTHTVSVPVDPVSSHVVDVRAAIGDVSIHPLE